MRKVRVQKGEVPPRCFPEEMGRGCGVVPPNPPNFLPSRKDDFSATDDIPFPPSPNVQGIPPGAQFVRREKTRGYAPLTRLHIGETAKSLLYPPPKTTTGIGVPSFSFF